MLRYQNDDLEALWLNRRLACLKRIDASYPVQCDDTNLAEDLEEFSDISTRAKLIEKLREIDRQ